MTTHDQHSEVNELDAGDQVVTADSRPTDEHRRLSRGFPTNP